MLNQYDLPVGIMFCSKYNIYNGSLFSGYITLYKIYITSMLLVILIMISESIFCTHLLWYLWLHKKEKGKKIKLEFFSLQYTNSSTTTHVSCVIYSQGKNVVYIFDGPFWKNTFITIINICIIYPWVFNFDRKVCSTIQCLL